MGSRGSRAGTTLKSRVPAGVGWGGSTDNREIRQVASVESAAAHLAGVNPIGWTGGLDSMTDGLAVGRSVDGQEGRKYNLVWDTKGELLGTVIYSGGSPNPTIFLSNGTGPSSTVKYDSLPQAVKAIGTMYDERQVALRTGTRSAETHPLSGRFTIGSRVIGPAQARNLARRIRR